MKDWDCSFGVTLGELTELGVGYEIGVPGGEVGRRKRRRKVICHLNGLKSA